VSEDARAILRELLAEVLAGHGNGNGHAPPAAAGGAPPAGPPPVPAPPTAAVLRPSTWDRPAAPGELIGDGAKASAAGEPEPVTIASDADLDRFVRALAARCEDPAARAALRSGAVRYTLGGGTAIRVESGAVTEKTVKQAAASGARLVLAPRAVLTPLARERARALNVEVERERRW
jgi:hypothetical protein